MIDYNKELVAALGKVLPTYDELRLTSNSKTPCYSYQERNNYAEATGDTIGYSRIVFTVKVWACDLETLNRYAKEADKILRPIGFRRTSTNELAQAGSTMRQKIMTFEALALEEFE